MELILTYISMSILSIYAMVGLFVFLGFYITSVKKNNPVNKKFISIIIPFRNEAKNLAGLIDSLQQLNYPKENFEVIFVNDHSTDDGSELIRQSGLENLILIDSRGEGKKAAIANGIEKAKGELIASTDADCIVPTQWLEEINQAGTHSMVLGPVQLNPANSFLQIFQEIEFAALQSISASTANWKIPLMSNGANLAYHKNEFNEAVLKKETASGDDIFLLEDFKKRKLPIRFLWNQQSIVKTKPVETLKELTQQKIRWASKSKHNKNFLNTAMGILIALMNLVVLVNYLNFVFTYPGNNYSIMIVIAKLIVDILIILPYLILIKKPWLVFTLPPFVLLYPYYFFYILILSLRGKFTWKERTLRV